MTFTDPRPLPCQISRQRAKFNDRARTLFHPSAACSPPIYPLGPPPNGLAALARLGWNDLRMALRHSVGGEGTTKQQKRAPSLTLWAAFLTQKAPPARQRFRLRGCQRAMSHKRLRQQDSYFLFGYATVLSLKSEKCIHMFIFYSVVTQLIFKMLLHVL